MRHGRRSRTPQLSFPLALSLLAAIPGGAALAQEDQPLSTFLGTAEVNLVNVDVVVTDADGVPVTGLGIDDFELYENGEPRPISNFAAMMNGRPVDFDLPTADRVTLPLDEIPLAPQHFMVYIDNVNLHPINRARIFERLRDYLRDNWTDELRVSLASNERGLVVHQPFTSDQRSLFWKLGRLEQESGMVDPTEMDRYAIEHQIAAVDLENVRPGVASFATAGQDIADPVAASALLAQEASIRRIESEAMSIIPQIRSYAGNRFNHLRGSLATLQQYIDSAAGIEGRKALLYIGDGIELHPAESLYDSFYRRFKNLPTVGSQFSVNAEAATFDLTDLVTRLVARANSARVTLYALSAKAPGGSETSLAESDARPSRDLRAYQSRFSGLDELGNETTMALMANGTGGRMATTAAMIPRLLEATLDDFENFYSIGFVVPPEEGLSEKPRRIEVRPKLRELRARYRRSAMDRTPDQRMEELTISGLLLDGGENPLEVSLKSDEAAPDGEGNFVVPLHVQLPVSSLVLLPDEQIHQAQVALFIAVLDEERRTSAVSKNLCPIRIRNDQLASAMGRQVSCGIRLRMRGGPQKIAVGVRDELAAIDSVVSLDLDVGAGGG